MRLEIRSRGLEPCAAWQDSIRRRLGFALGRFGPRIGRVTVCLADADARCGGSDTRCRIVARLLSAGRVCVEVTDTDPNTALNRAAQRIGPAVVREFLRRLDDGRNRGR
jgi:hypothetical protein